jgi:pyruvate carboxylase subunit B
VRYVVDVDGERHVVAIDAAQASVDGIDTSARIDAVEGTPVRVVRIGDAVHRIVVRPGDRRGRYTIWIDGFRHEIDALDERTRAIQDLAAASAGPRGPAPLIAPMPGLIVRVSASPGQRVTAGTGLVVMEAMKMENELRAIADGTVKAVHARAGQAVEKGMVLVELE